jgi:hypothetical protein
MLRRGELSTASIAANVSSAPSLTNASKFLGPLAGRRSLANQPMRNVDPKPAGVAALGLAVWMRRDWDFFLTLTTAVVLPRPCLTREFTSVFLRGLSRAAQRRVGWWYCIEASNDGLTVMR